ncbi:putrescine transporter subunit: membrane component of ABC superfamily [Salmonella enterica subsp. enterica]|uniref:Putrescine transporter subunit: membrane component of ABC superfamily n=1 Tax=Salmonella enterica I TaxID=59201 RepID=A0A379WWH8_SALET|nr:putrescine transporter subunit: membrane component of ABC superfamily [Salmonella enterica subsp. enterica]
MVGANANETWRKLVIALPYIWLILLFLLPFLIVFKISLAEMRGDPAVYRSAGMG